MVYAIPLPSLTRKYLRRVLFLFTSNRCLMQDINKKFILDKLSQAKFSVDGFHSYVTLLGVGVIIGFVCGRYFKLLLVSALLAVLVIKGMEKQSLLKINWIALTSMFGFSPNLTLEQAAQEVYILLTNNIYFTLTGFIGFIIGYRAG